MKLLVYYQQIPNDIKTHMVDVSKLATQSRVLSVPPHSQRSRWRVKAAGAESTLAAALLTIISLQNSRFTLTSAALQLCYFQYVSLSAAAQPNDHQWPARHYWMFAVLMSIETIFFDIFVFSELKTEQSQLKPAFLENFIHLYVELPNSRFKYLLLRHHQ